MRRAFKISGITLAILVIVVALALGLIVRGIGAPWVLGRLAELAGATLKVEGMRGGLYGPLEIDHLVFENSELRVEASGVALDWVLEQSRRVHVRYLRTREIAYRTKPASPEPATLPASLASPIAVRVDELRADRLVIESADEADKGGKVASAQTLTRLLGSASIDGERLQARIESLDTEYGAVRATIELGAIQPYALSGTFALSKPGGGAQPYAYSAEATLGGTLERIAIDGSAHVDVGAAKVRMVLTPFAPLPLADFEIDAHDIDPTRIRPGLPEARVRVQAHGRMSAQDRFEGEVELTNTRPGTIDRNRLPVRSARASLAGNASELRILSLAIDLGAGGQARGSGSFAQSQLALSLSTSKLNANGLHSQLRATRLAGTVELTVSDNAQRVRGRLAQNDLAVAADAERVGMLLRVRSLDVQTGAGSLAASGTLGLAGEQRFEAKGSLSRFDPSKLGKFPAGSINANFNVSGRAAPTAGGRSIDLAFTIPESVYAGYPLQGDGTLSATEERLNRANVRLLVAGNRLVALGAFGAPGDELRVELDAPALDRLGREFAGTAKANIQVSGSWRAPRAEFSVTASGLRAPGQVTVGALNGNGRIDAKRLDVTLAMQRIHVGEVKVDTGELRLAGTPDDHRATLKISAPDISLDAAAHGSLVNSGANPQREGIAAKGWRGSLDRLVSGGRYPFELMQPAEIEVSTDRVRVRDLRLAVADGRVQVDLLDRSSASANLTARGELRSISVPKLLAMARVHPEVNTDLVVSGEWDVALGETLRGRASLRRERGDVWFAGRREQSLGLSKLMLAASADANRVRIELAAAGERLGELTAEGTTFASRQGDAWGIAGNAPLTGQATLDMRSLRWLRSFTEEVVVDGEVRGQVALSGTVATPRLAGALNGEKFRVRVPSQRIALRDGHFEIGFENTTATIKQALFAGQEGTLSAAGAIEWKNSTATGQLSFTADRLDALNDPDRDIVLSGRALAALRAGVVSVTGRLRADRGVFRLPEFDTPTLSKDVVIVGAGDAKRDVRSMPSTEARVDLEFDLGDQFFLRGKGLDTRLEGSLRVRTNEAGLLRVVGTVRAVDGTFLAYGQKLTIDRGIVSFNGPIDNPNLNIVAVRKDLPVEAGVEVTGTALSPRVRLVSTPDVPDTDKLSWLVLGHGSDQVSGNDLGVLASAAAALLGPSDAVPLQTRLARAVGLDDISVRQATVAGTGLQDTIVSVGKKISSKLYASVEQSLQNVGTVLKLKYQWTPRFSLQTTTGFNNAVDVFYTLRFDEFRLFGN